MPIDVTASKKIESVEDLILGGIPHRLLDTDKVARVLALAVWARPVKIVSHRTLYAGMSGLKSTM
jgi:hypothetical protein